MQDSWRLSKDRLFEWVQWLNDPKELYEDLEDLLLEMKNSAYPSNLRHLNSAIRDHQIAIATLTKRLVGDLSHYYSDWDYWCVTKETLETFMEMAKKKDVASLRRAFDAFFYDLYLHSSIAGFITPKPVKIKQMISFHEEMIEHIQKTAIPNRRLRVLFNQ